ncbi:hydroxylamine reductase [Oceanispirochaeta crateris]|uniref:Hydroxylamine reductase n=1 Tax=Oceanispirochaeta crateris TaxID=2518645 RepID=A0A5C1QJS7_9SPIO|nr:hydroxylamine reductase [Oceanispirochaeta crateris]QEN08393.1 hydroxylamine reductase [Oceanispirochaeta crateris]
MSMFCFQCQEAAKGTGCEIRGVCGKEPETAVLQDLLIYTLKGIAQVAGPARLQGKILPEADQAIMRGLFMTITNANFDNDVFVKTIIEDLALRDKLKGELGDLVPSKLHDAATFTVLDAAKMQEKGEQVGVMLTKNEDIRSLRELIIYGLKGMAAYAYHADHLAQQDESVLQFMYKALYSTLDDSLTVDDLVGLTLETGANGVSVMALLDKANTESYGNPEITEVNIGTGSNPGILISGHDLRDMESLLKQTEGTGVDVYTHSEMLPANYYPSFKKYSHFVGNYGNAWWKQDKEFASFNGPILMTTNCITPPKASYIDRMFTTGAAGYPGVKFLDAKLENGDKDFSAVIEAAKKCDPPVEIETGTIVGGFAHSQVLALADKVVDAVKSGAIKRFFVMAGCDGRMKGRDYYTEFARQLPEDTIILTAGCAKYRYNKLPLGDIGGIPRVLDAGQCNDSYSLAVTALKLKEVFELNDINDLPISYNIAWYEQKAVIVLLALLSLGVKDIHLGPTLPAFLSPNVAKVLVENFGIAGIGAVEEDIQLFMGA